MAGLNRYCNPIWHSVYEYIAQQKVRGTNNILDRYKQYLFKLAVYCMACFVIFIRCFVLFLVLGLCLT